MSSKLISGLLQHFEHCFVYLLQRKMMKCRIPDRACAAGRSLQVMTESEEHKR
jgi:hypothetical protein